MHSSTSSSDFRFRLATWLLLAGVLAICAITEVLSGMMLDRGSQTQRRINAEMPKVLGLHQTAFSRPSILIVGNSLLVHGLDLPLLDAELVSCL